MRIQIEFKISIGQCRHHNNNRVRTKCTDLDKCERAYIQTKQYNIGGGGN